MTDRSSIPHPAESGSPSSQSVHARRRFAELMLGAATLIWGSTFVFIKLALVDVSPLFFVSARFLTAALILTALFYPRLRSIDRASFKKGLVLGTILCIGFLAQTVGLQYTTASKSAFITGMLVVFTPLLQFIIQRRSPTLGNVVGVIFVTVGLYLLTSPRGAEFNIGDGLTLICAFLFGLYIVYLDIISKQMEIFHLTYLQIITTGVLSMVFALIFEDIRVNPTINLIVAFLYLTIFATLLTTYVQTRYQRDTTPTRAAIIFSMEPVFAAFLAFLVLNEIIGSLGIVGGGVIVAGLLVSELSDEIPLLRRRFLRTVPRDF